MTLFVEKLVRAAGVVAAVACAGFLIAALFTSTPMLLRSSLSHEDRVWPVHMPETRPAKLGELAVAPGAAYGCVVLSRPDGTQVTSICHHHLGCLDDSAPPRADATGFDIYQPGGHGPYYLQVSSRCDSGCCDARSTRLSAEGARLDDSLWDRLWNRLWYPGAAALVGAIVGGIQLRRSAEPRKQLRLWAWISVSASLAAACLWHAL